MNGPSKICGRRALKQLKAEQHAKQLPSFKVKS